jgi:ribosome-binding protein aMBF1 (putative translation factor)
VAGTSFDAWASDQQAAETAAESELRRRFEAAFAVGLQISEARRALGLSQRALAEKSGIPQADISRIKRGGGNPTEMTLLRLAGPLGLRLALVPA